MSFDLVLFGGTGDLAWRKLMPALFQAFRHGTLPSNGRIIGVGRDDLSSCLPASLGHTRDLAAHDEITQFTAAQTELAIHAARTTR